MLRTIHVRCTDDQYIRIKAKAEMLGLASISDYIRIAVLDDDYVKERIKERLKGNLMRSWILPVWRNSSIPPSNGIHPACLFALLLLLLLILIQIF